MKSKLKEEKRQLLRKENEKSSRFLDNYYNPNVHKKIWEPSGSVKTKNKYVYGDTGLSYNIMDSSLKQKNIEPIHFLEFDFLEDNDVIVIIEYYSNSSAKHFNQSNYNKDIYKNLAKLLQLCINTRYPFIKTILKPTDMNNKMNRAGAFEIQLGMKINDNKTITTIFSKLNCNPWPNFNNILNKINNIVPVLNIKCTIYDKEDDIENNSIVNNNTNGLDGMNNNIGNDALLALPSKYENIKIK